MSRVIKFRAWCLDNKWMEECFYIQAHNGVVFDVPSKTYDTPNIEIEESPNLVVMQFTGLTDKNGVDIYEDDVIDVQYNYIGNVIVEFKNGKFSASEYCLAKCEVIGNVHQHPELLK